VGEEGEWKGYADVAVARPCELGKRSKHFQVMLIYGRERREKQKMIWGKTGKKASGKQRCEQ